MGLTYIGTRSKHTHCCIHLSRRLQFHTNALPMICHYMCYGLKLFIFIRIPVYPHCTLR